MLEFKDIEYGELLQRCAYCEIDQDGFRFNVGNYVVVLGDKDTGRVYIAAVCITVSELRKRLVELREDCKYWGEVVTSNVYRVVPTRDDDEEYEELEDDFQPSRFTVLVPYIEFPYREFYACLVAGVVEDTADCYGMDLLRGDYVLLEKTESDRAPYRLAGSYDFIEDKDTLDILRRVVTGAKLLRLS